MYNAFVLKGLTVARLYKHFEGAELIQRGF